MRYILFLVLMVSVSYALSCTGYIDDNTSLYDYRCAADMLNIRRKDYTWTMALLGGFTGLVFLSSIIYIIFKIGKSYRA